MEMPQNNTVGTAKTTPKDVFMHLLGLVTLYGSVVSFITLLFQYVNHLHPDQLTYYYQSVLNSVRWSASVLVVMFPVYLIVTKMVNRESERDPAKKDIKIRKWFTYLTLFISAVTLIIDVIVLVYNFLGGDLTINFLLKIAVVLFVAGSVFGYYLWDLKRAPGDRTKLNILSWVVTLVILIAVGGSYTIIGSPQKQRDLNFDQIRSDNLRAIQNRVVSYWQQKNELPKTMADLNDNIAGFTVPTDPKTNQPYEYIVKDALNFQLCAQFAYPSVNEGMNSFAPTTVIKDPYGYDQSWIHTSGRFCFDRTIDLELQRLPEAVPVK